MSARAKCARCSAKLALTRGRKDGLCYNCANRLGAYRGAKAYLAWKSGRDVTNVGVGYYPSTEPGARRVTPSVDPEVRVSQALEMDRAAREVSFAVKMEANTVTFVLSRDVMGFEVQDSRTVRLVLK